MKRTLPILKLSVIAMALAGLVAIEVSAASPVDRDAAGEPWPGALIANSHDGLCGGEPCDAVVRGLLHFFDPNPEGLGGNGRSCNDCHMVTDRFQLSPANAERRFQLLQWRRRFNPNADDPLFRPIDADDFRTNGDEASNFSNLRENGLIRIAFDLPPNIRVERIEGDRLRVVRGG